MDYSAYSDLLHGSLDVTGIQDDPPKVIKVFLSATHTDMVEERCALMQDVFPKLREYCRQRYGLEFQVLDPRWGCDSDWHDWHTDRQLALHEVLQCKRDSAGPTFLFKKNVKLSKIPFVALIGQRYGCRPVPSSIAVPDFEVIREAVNSHRNRDTRDFELLDIWYAKDTNVIPPVYRLVVKEIGMQSQKVFYQKNNLILGRGDLPSPEWEETRQCLRRLVNKGVEYCLHDESLSDDVAFWYMSSDLEKEIDLGLLRSYDPDNYCLMFTRNIVDLKNYLGHKAMPRFLEVQYNEVESRVDVDQTALNSVNALKQHKVPNVLRSANRQGFEILWKHDKGVDPRLHADYMQELCFGFENSIKELIDNCASKQLSNVLPPLAEEVTQHWRVARDRSHDFIGREDMLEVINSYILSNDNRPFVVYGESGSGKTAIMAKAASEAYKIVDEDTIIMTRFIGTTASSCDTRQLLYNICLQIAVCLGKATNNIPNEYKELQSYFFETLNTFPEEKNLVIFIDALQILAPQYNAHYLYWVPRLLNENVKIVLSTLPETHNILTRLKSEVIQTENNFMDLAPMPLNECVDLLKLKLGQEKRCLHTDQECVINEAFRACSYPLYVLLTLTEVRTWTSMTEPADLPLSMKEFIHHIMDRLENKHGKILVSRSLAYLTASTTGLSDCEMEDLLSLDDDVLNEFYGRAPHRLRRLPSIVWVRLKKDIQDFLIAKENEGVSVYFWFHRMFIEVTKNRYLVDETSRKAIHSSLADYNLGIWYGKGKPYMRASSAENHKDVMESGDRLVPSQPLTFQYESGVTRYNKRKYEQVPRHLYLSGRLDELNSLVLFSYEFLYNKTKALSLEHILADFVLNPGVEATLVERALRDAQPFMEVNIDNMAPEITGRLLSYYSTHPNIRKLINECDTSGLKHCALIPNFPYHQVPGSPLRYTIKCQRKPTHFALCGENSRFIIAKQASEQLVEIFDLATGEPSTEINTSIGDMYVTPNGHYIIVVDHITEKSIKVHTTDTGKYVGQLIPMTKVKKDPKSRYQLSKLSVNDSFICFTVTTGGRSYVCIADLEFCKFTEVIELQGSSNICTITPDSRYVFCNSAETLLAYDLCTLEQTTNTALDHRPSQIVFTADVTKGFHVNTKENKVYVMLIKDGYVELMYKLPVEESFPGDKVSQLRVSQNQEMLLLVGKSNLLVYHIGSEKVIAHIKRPTDIPVEFKLPRSHYQDISFTNADFSPDNKFVIATIFRNVYIWNVANNRLLTTLQAPVGIISEMLIPSDRGQIVTHLKDAGIVHVWSLGDAIGHVGMLDRLTTAVHSIITTADDKLAFVRCYGSDEIGVLDMKSGQLIDLLTHESAVVSFNITADGEYAIVAVEDAKAGTYNKIWHIAGRRVIYEYGNVPAAVIPLETECTMISITQQQHKFKEPYNISQFKFREGTFEEYQFDQTLPFMLSKPFITPEDKYLVLLSADDYDETNAHYVNPTICAVSLKANVDICTYSARDLREIVCMRRILHIRPYANNSYTVIVIFTNEPDITHPDDGRKSTGYDYSFGFMIFDIAAGVVCQVLDNFLSPQTPVDRILFTKDVSLCLDHESNVFDMATGYYMKRIHQTEGVVPRRLALGGSVALYYDKCHMYAIRVSDARVIGHVNVHGQISCLEIGKDERTVILGCEDGSLISYVLIDELIDTAEEVLPNMLSRQAPLQSFINSTLVRSWDKVDFENALNGPPYSRPPSAVFNGPSNKDILKKVKPLTRPRSRDRPRSDTTLYSSPNTSRACIVM